VKEIESAAADSRTFIEFAVSDNGIGIKAEDSERIFDRFEQADGSMDRQFGGAGLGLSLAKSLVELHGGKIWAESEGEGKGSTFRLIIPA
jgi:signal transduction histidine kinase